jgi:hypothetical protein
MRKRAKSSPIELLLLLALEKEERRLMVTGV